MALPRSDSKDRDMRLRLLLVVAVSGWSGSSSLLRFCVALTLCADDWPMDGILGTKGQKEKEKKRDRGRQLSCLHSSVRFMSPARSL